MYFFVPCLLRDSENEEFACVRYLVVLPFHAYLKRNSDINHLCRRCSKPQNHTLELGDKVD